MINFEKDGKKYQITFKFPDKHAGIKRRYTYATLSLKIENPENPQDYVWEHIDETYSICNFHIYNNKFIWGDRFDKYTGRKVAFTKLIKKNFDRESRKELWKLFFSKYGFPLTLRKHIILDIFPQ